jgi:hypothetical protein
LFNCCGTHGFDLALVWDLTAEIKAWLTPEKLRGNFSASQILQALNAIDKHGPKGASLSVEIAANEQQALFAAGVRDGAALLGKDAPADIPAAFHAKPASSFDPALYQAGAKSAEELKPYMRSAR